MIPLSEEQWGLSAGGRALRSSQLGLPRPVRTARVTCRGVLPRSWSGELGCVLCGVRRWAWGSCARRPTELVHMVEHVRVRIRLYLHTHPYALALHNRNSPTGRNKYRSPVSRVFFVNFESTSHIGVHVRSKPNIPQSCDRPCPTRPRPAHKRSLCSWSILWVQCPGLCSYPGGRHPLSCL